MKRSSVRRHTRCACGAIYGQMRTGLTFSKVAQQMKTHDPKTYRAFYRRGVLGYWRELKLMQWEYLHGACGIVA